jgi:hypothetical protein
MRKLVFTILAALALPFVSHAQGRIAEIWTQPAVFTPDEQVSFFFDVTGTALDGETEGVYLWSWFPSEPDAGNWANSSDFAALKYVSGNVWRLDLKPTDYYKKPANEIVAFYGLLKNKDGSKVTDAFAPDQSPRNDIQVFDLTSIKGSELMDYYPKNFTKTRPLSILINANNTWSGCDVTPVQGDLAKATNVHIHSGVNLWNVVVENNPANLAKTQLTALGGGIYRMDFILKDYFNLADDYVLNNINFVLANDTWSNMGKDKACADFMIKAPEAPVELIPELYFFPQKISQKDILCIIRKNNETGVTKLSYTITAGTQKITGDFEGGKSDMRAFINLNASLKGITGLDKISVVITDNNGRTISTTNLQLVQNQ